MPSPSINYNNLNFNYYSVQLPHGMYGANLTASFITNSFYSLIYTTALGNPETDVYYLNMDQISKLCEIYYPKVLQPIYNTDPIQSKSLFSIVYSNYKYLEGLNL